MRRSWQITGVVGIVAIVVLVMIVALWPRGYVQGRLEIWYGLGGYNSDDVMELNTQKWLITDDADYYLEFLPSCQLVRINEGKSVNSIHIGNRWFLIKNEAIYRLKGDVVDGAPSAHLDQWALKADDKGNFTKVAPTGSGKRTPRTMKVRYIEFVRSANGADK